MSGERCLHCDINEVVREHMEGKDTINLPDLIAKMGESLVDLILLGPENQWSNLLAAAKGCAASATRLSRRLPSSPVRPANRPCSVSKARSAERARSSSWPKRPSAHAFSWAI